MERTRQQRKRSGAWGGGLIKSAAETSVAAESGELPNLVLYPPKY